jgi:hypothetical protein
VLTSLALAGSYDLESTLTNQNSNVGLNGDNLQQTGKYLHAIGHCSIEQDHDTDAREAGFTPERVWDERRSLMLDLMVHPADKSRNSGESDNQQCNGLCSLDVVDICRERPGKTLVSHNRTFGCRETVYGVLTPKRMTKPPSPYSR